MVKECTPKPFFDGKNRGGAPYATWSCTWESEGSTLWKLADVGQRGGAADVVPQRAFGGIGKLRAVFDAHPVIGLAECPVGPVDHLARRPHVLSGDLEIVQTDEGGDGAGRAHAAQKGVGNEIADRREIAAVRLAAQLRGVAIDGTVTQV